jgi:hypothetical protein
MEQASMTTDNLRNTMATVEAMKSANKEMKKQYGKLDIDKIEVGREISIVISTFVLMRVRQSIHYDMEDLIEQANEIQESLGRSYGVPEEVDEADLEAGSSSVPSNVPPRTSNLGLCRAGSIGGRSPRKRDRHTVLSQGGVGCSARICRRGTGGERTYGTLSANRLGKARCV